MKVRFFLLGTQKHGSAQRFEEELRQIFFEHLTDDGDIQSFDTIKDASSDIAKAVTDSHALVFIADLEQYGSTKLMLGKAFGFELNCDTELLQKACEHFGKDPQVEDYDFSVAHAFVAGNSRAFVLDDGLYAGFSVANGNQTIILLPFEKNRTSVLVSSQVIPYINASYHVSINTEGLKKYNAGKLFETLDSHGASIAVAGTNTASFLKEYLSVDERLADKVNISPVAEKRGNMQPVDYVVNLSITASEFLSCRYSVAISNAFYTGDGPESEKIVYLAVSNERETAVREMHSFKGEEIPAFLTRCCGDLCVFIADVIADDDVFSSDVKIRENAAVKRYKIAVASVAAVIVAVVIFCAAYFNANDYSIGTWYNNFMEWVFPAGNPFDGMFDKNVPGEDEEIITDGTEAEENTDETSDIGEEGTSEEASTEEETGEADTFAEIVG